MKPTKINYMDWNLHLKILSLLQLKHDSRAIDPSSKKVRLEVSRASHIPSQLVGYQVQIHNGLRFVSLTITEDMIGYRFGEFVTTTAWATQQPKTKVITQRKK